MGQNDEILARCLRRGTPFIEEEKAVFREAWAADPESGSVTGLVWTVLNMRQFLFIQ